jgi:hypothetical protein
MEKGKMTNLVNATFDGSGAVNQGDSRLNSPMAREHQPHVSTANKMTEHVTEKPSHGALGGRQHSK